MAEILFLRRLDISFCCSEKDKIYCYLSEKSGPAPNVSIDSAHKYKFYLAFISGGLVHLNSKLEKRK